jgi:exosortase K
VSTGVASARGGTSSAGCASARAGQSAGKAGRGVRLGLSPWDLVAVAVVLLAAYQVKRFASHAGAHELDCLLRPTAALVSALSGHVFEPEPGAGYTSRELFVVIAPVCSGVNFAIVAFTALACGFVPRVRRPLGKLGWVLACVPVAYVTTVVTNALRIAFALALGPRLVALGWASAEAAHRGIGVAVYLASLLALSALAGALLGVRRGSATVPLLVYLAVTLVTPLLRGVALDGRFVAHAGVVLGAAGFVSTVLWLRSSFGFFHRGPLGRVAEGTLGSGRVPGLLVAARPRGERSLPRQ